jgi:transposase
MAKSNDSSIISVVHPVCCGIDVHKEKLSACLIKTEESGTEEVLIQEFQTFTDELIRLREWLIEHDCPVVAMESTGVYWQPVHNVIEGCFAVILVNARHVKKVPGRKTDISDSKWLAGLLRHGLLRGSFIPPREVREWRDLTRLRRKHTETLGDYKRRTQKLFESANIKIDSVASDLFGVTGRNLMKLLLSGKSKITESDVKKSMRGRIKNKEDELYRSAQGFFSEHHRFILSSLLQTVEMVENEIKRIDQRLRTLTSSHADLLERLQEVTGVAEVSSHAIVAEIGPTLETFPSSAAISSWAGVCPGNNESAGKRHSGRSPVHRNHLKTILVEVAWAAVKKKGSYYKEKFHRLKARRGSKRAIVAIAHKLLKCIYHIIKDGTRFKDLGEQFLTLRNKALALLQLKRKAHQLGYTLVPREQ